MDTLLLDTSGAPNIRANLRGLMHRRRAISGFLLVALVGAARVGATQDQAPARRVEGTVVRASGEGIGGVTVVLEQLRRAELTDAEGRFAFGNVPPGDYSLSLTLGPYVARRDGAVVATTSGARERIVVDWPISVFESVIVTATSRLPSRLVEAPASSTVLTLADLAPHGVHGQLARALAGAPGVEVAQSGLYDFNLNNRGFNTFYNRHVLTRIDGRDPSPPHLLGYLDWAALSFPLDDLEQLEFVHGPGAALYGAGAFNGVLNLRSRNPRDSLGGKLRVTVGELNTQRVEGRYAGFLGRGWYFKGLGGVHQSDDFTRSRAGDVEYAPETLPRDLVPPVLDRVRLAFGSLRLDKYFGDDRLVTVETGTAHQRGPVTVSPVARTQAVDADSPWVRVNLAQPRWNFLAYHTANRLDEQLDLTSNRLLYLRSSHTAIELQGNRPFAGTRGRLIGGVEFGRQRVNSEDPSGAQSVFARAVTARHGSVFGQVEYNVRPDVKTVISARWDRSTLHDGSLSPRAALVYSVTPSQTLRLTYSKAFQAPSITEFFLRFAVAPPLDLAPLESALLPLLGGASLGFSAVPLLAVGNENLRVERVDSIEGGYQGVLGAKILLSVSAYRNVLKDFTTNLLPQTGTSLGRLNPDYGVYQPPAVLSPFARDAVLAGLGAALPPPLLNALSNDASGEPVIALLSFANFGRATTQGLEVGAKYLLSDGWRLEGALTVFGSNIKEDAPENPLRPNAPPRQISAAAIHDARLSGSLRVRWVEGFDWISGIYVGRIPSYGVADASAAYALSGRTSVGVDVANLFDNDHFEVFGGDLLGRRALAYLAYSW